MIEFDKFDGAGNDFVIVDAREHDPHFTPEQIAHICHRRFGVGADGLMTFHADHDGYDFEMRYYNSDGYPADMCGNGGRCIVFFAYTKNKGEKKMHYRFLAADGSHEADILSIDENNSAVVKLGMRDVPAGEVRQVLGGTLLNTGVPHLVVPVSDLEHFDVVGKGRELRHHPDLGKDGANVNFVEKKDGRLYVRTYERGVEDETLACGTGVTACALVTGCKQIEARGGSFEVDFVQPTSDSPSYTQVKLTGPVSFNFSGVLSLEKYN